MAEARSTEQDIADVAALLRGKLGVRAATLDGALRKARHRMPRAVYKQGLRLAGAEPLAGHPKLRLTLDRDGLRGAAAEVRTYLEAQDRADRRKGWWLGMLGGLAFNILLFAVLVVLVLRWRGFV